MKKNIALKIGFVIILIFVWLIVFNVSLFLGLQVSPTLGNIGVIVSVLLLIIFIILYKKIINKQT